MPHSPHQKTIHAPIDNLGDYTSALARHRAEIEDDVRDKYRDETLLAISEELLEHCEFLEEKLRIKKEQCDQSSKLNQASQSRVHTLKAQVETLETENADLKAKVEKFEKEATAKGEQHDSTSGMNGNREDHETTAGQSNARKRTAESDTDRDGDAAKRVKET